MDESEKGIADLQNLMQNYAAVLAKATGNSDGMLQETVSKILADIDKYEDKECLRSWAKVVGGKLLGNCAGDNGKHDSSFIDGHEYVSK